MLNETHVIVINSSRAHHQFAQIPDVLPDNTRNLIQLGQFVAVMNLVHALRAHQLLAHPAEVLNELVCVLCAVHLANRCDASVHRSDGVEHLRTAMGGQSHVVLVMISRLGTLVMILCSRNRAEALVKNVVLLAHERGLNRLTHEGALGDLSGAGGDVKLTIPI